MYTSMLVNFLSKDLPESKVREILQSAGETRSIETLQKYSAWSSYHQFRRLLEEGMQVLEAANLERGSSSGPFVATNPEMAESIQAFGSPDAILAASPELNPLLPIRRYDTTEIAPNHWTVREWFVEGFEPYPEFCRFIASQYSLIPMFFGLPAAKVVQVECECNGDDACLFEISWETPNSTATESGYYKIRSQLLESRLEKLEAMITDLAANDRYEDVLQSIVGSSLQAVGAAGAVLALESRVGSPRRFYFEGLSPTDAETMAHDLLDGGIGRQDITAVNVASGRRRYGVLACDHQGGVFAAQTLSILETYGRLAAATLDSADAFEDAHHQANTAEVLLNLATSLAKIVSAPEMAAKLTHAVPLLIDCDRVAIFLDRSSGKDGSGAEFNLVASSGYSDEHLKVLRSPAFDLDDYPDGVRECGIERNLFSRVGNVAAVSVDITSANRTIGWISAAVTSDPDRLTVTPRLAVRLKGLAAQASIAFSNANLVDQIRFQAVHDPLTGLPNRSLLLDRIEQMLARARRMPVQVGALFVDLDGFKEINDTLGHGAGDELLCAVAVRLSTTMRGGDSVGRLGGDEFVVLVDGSTMDIGPELVAERLLEVLREPFEIESAHHRPILLTASIGIALGLRDSATELLRDADTALYEAKSAGKNRIVAFRPEMHTAVQDHLLLEMDLRDALRLNQYFLVYQPIFNLASGETTGVEALLRWRHPDRGVVEPDRFIPILESSGMIVETGLWVLEQACQQAAEWQKMGFGLDISVNVSAHQLDSPHFVEDVARSLRIAGLLPQALTIEITETSIMRDVEAVIPRLAELKATGIKIAIDDFGTGYSSLASLQRFPVDTIKIDRSFISAMATSPESGAMIRTLVQLGKALGLETLAEGIEETEQYSQLEKEHCDSGQGYLFARPLEAEAVETFLANRHGHRQPTRI